MKQFFTTLFALTTLLFFFNTKLTAQCSTQACGIPVAAYDAPSACILPNPQALNCYYGQTISNPPVSMPPFWCTSVENNQWFAFTATGPNVSFDIEALNCASGGAIQAALLETTDCNTFSFVSDCLGNIPSGSTQTLTNNVPLNPGQNYYLMIDGSAGAQCNFAINGSSSITSGPQQICIPVTGGSFYTSTSNSSWSINPPTFGTFIGANTGTNVAVDWTQPGSAQICAQNLNCPNIPPFCLTVNIGEYAAATYNVNVCTGGSVTCGGTTYTAGGTFQSNVPAPSGCDSLITCIVNQIPPISSPTQTVNLCGPITYQLCNDFYGATGFYTSTCTSWQGCDSVASVNLTILEPMASINPPEPLGCGIDSIQFLDGSGSSFAIPPVQGQFLWTGPGIVGANNQVICQINQPGQYCLRITLTAPGGFSCNNETCVTVTENVIIPSAPQITGPTNVCSNQTATYTANLQGPVIPDNLTWITPNGEPVTPGPNNTAVVNWTGSQGGQLCVTANNECGSSPPACINVTVAAGPPTPVITGPATVCANNTVQSYTISNFVAGVNYTWTVPPGATFSGSGQTINVNFSGAAPGNVTVCATGTNNCGTSQAGCANVTVTGPPNTPTMTGPPTVCANGGAATFTVTNPQTGVTYSWTAPNGAVITGSGASVTIDFANANSGQVCVTANNSCGNPSVCQAVQVIPAPQATISGSGEFCQGTTPNLPLTLTVTGGTAPWTVVYSNGGNQATATVDVSPYTINVSAAGTYTLVSVTGASGCTGTVSGSGVITQNPTPTATVSGGGSICAGSGQTVPLTIALTGEAPWNLCWAIDGVQQSNLSINSSPFTLPIDESLAGTITLCTLTDNNGCTGSGTGSADVEVFNAPTVSNVATLCEPTNTTYTVTFTVNGGDAASYSVTPAGTLVGGQFTSNPIPTGAGYSFVVTDANDCNPITVADPIVVCDCDTEVGDMDQATIENCGPGTVTGIYDNTMEFLDGNDVQVFILHSGPSVSIVPPIISTSTSSDVTFNPATMSFGTTYYLSAVVGDDDGSGGVVLTDPCLQVAQGTPIVFYDLPTATLDGGGEVCAGNNYDLNIALTGTSPWQVTINGSAISIFSSPFTYTVNPAATTTFNMTAVTDVNCDNSVNDSETVTVNTSPTVSNIVTTCDPTGTTFTVCFQINGGDPSCYDVQPANGTLTGNQFCSNPIASGLGYNFVVSDCNNCPSVTVEDNIVDCDCLSTAGNMNATPLSVCGTDMAIGTYNNTGEFLDADDALCFILHAGNPNQPLASNSVPEFSFQTGMTYGQTYFICPVVGNSDGAGCVDLTDDCLNIGGCVDVVFHEIPTLSLTGDASICNGSSTTLAFSGTGVAPWSATYQDGQGNQFSLDMSTSPVNVDVNPSATTTYSLVDVFDQFCPGTVSGTATVTVNNPPQVQNVEETCSADATTYTLTFDIIGGTSPYTVTPATGLINGGSFTSAPIPSGNSYMFAVDDVNICGPVDVTGSQNCACLTNAGIMTTQVVEVCVNETLLVPATTGEFLDPDDVLVYYLHTGQAGSNPLGNVIATSNTPSFNFNPATMNAGTTYYVNAVAGNNNGSGGVDLTDGCLDISLATPVVFNALPTAGISGSTSICTGQSATVTFTLTGSGPFVVAYTVNGTPAFQNFANAGVQTITVTPTTTQTIQLISVTDDNCLNPATGTVTINLNQNVTAGNPTGSFAFCEGESQTINLADNLTGQTPGGVWQAPNGEFVPNGTFNVAGIAPGTHNYSYIIQGNVPCPNDTAIVQVVIHPNPTADAGSEVELNCDVTDAELGGPGNTPGVSFQWSANVSTPTVPNPTVTDPGIYVLTVTTPQGCTGTDEVEITEDVTPPSADFETSNISCFGDGNGVISITNITDGVPPYLCSFNGSPFSDAKTFTDLGPGTYEIVIQDAVGCSQSITATIFEPDSVSVEIIGSFEGNDPVVNLGDSVLMQIVTSPAFSELDSVIWYPADLVSCDTCQSNIIYPTQQTTIKVVIDEGGCIGEDNITVFVKKEHPIYVPNAFSPNGDGVNDVVTVFGGKQVKNIKSFLIFSRWGEAVYQLFNFQPNDLLNNAWDGKHRGEQLNPAVFSWFAEVEFTDGKIEIFEGSLTLVK